MRPHTRVRSARLIGLLAFAFLTACGGQVASFNNLDDADGQYGSLVNVAEFDASPDALPIWAMTRSRAPLPSKVMLTNLPSIATQGTPPKPLGSPGSCEAQSFAYGLGSYTAARNVDGSVKWYASQPQNQVSAAYQYKFQHHLEGKSCPKGSFAIPYLDRLISAGSPSAQDIPYLPDCMYIDGIPVNPAFPNMERFRIGSFSSFYIAQNGDDALQLIKEYLAQGHAIAFSGLVLKKYTNPPMVNGVIYTTDAIAVSGHGQMIVGYDDTIGDPSRPGALLIQNSFGPQWPPPLSHSAAPPGMAYWSYETFKRTRTLAATAFPREEQQPAGTELTTGSTNVPRAILVGAAQAAQSGIGPTYLTASMWFSEPVRIEYISLTEPGSTTSMLGSYGHNMGNGFLYFKRNDGNQFVAGSYGIKITARTLLGVSVTYTGTAVVGQAAPASPPVAPISSVAKITDSIGDSAIISN